MQPSHLNLEATRRAIRTDHVHAAGSTGLLLRERAQDAARRPEPVSLRGRVVTAVRTRHAG
jgi:hypothetical protein